MAVLMLVLALVVALVWQRSGTSRLTVDPARLTLGRVGMGEFREYSPFDGTVVPQTSVYLDVEGGGRVEEIFTDGGHYVEAGTLIMRLSNTSLQSSSISTETQLLEQLDQIANTQFNRTQSSLLLKESLLDLEWQIDQLQDTFDRYQALAASKVNPLTQQEYDRVHDELQYRKQRRDLLQERIRQEELLSARQLEQANNSVQRLRLSLELLEKMVESLEVKAPIAGHLSSIDAMVGQNIPSGSRIGQIDVLDKFKIRVAIDQFYVARIDVGTVGKYRLGDQEYPVTVSKIYPEVINNAFQADMEFAGPVPDTIRRGQSLTVELEFGAVQQSLMVRKGGFYQQTGGRWAYVVAADGRSASKVDIRLGRQNPQFVEVLEGLQEGEWIITSGYDSFNGMDRLVFTEALTL